MALSHRLMFPLALAVSLSVLALASDDAFIIRGNVRTLGQIQKAYAEMPPVQYAPPADRWQRLPKTRERLLNGGVLHVVMLGDSIVNDTSRSGWDMLVDRRHPTCRIEKVTSVRGSTGCWWYKEPGRVKQYVLDHMPDLVIIGGISQRNDISSIREVIRQIRGASQADVLLMTGAFGQTDPRIESVWQTISDPNQFTPYRKGLERLADETGAAFLDMEAAWGQCIRQSGKDLDWFKRDPIHANERGEQILGRILASYLSYPPRDRPVLSVPHESEGGCGQGRLRRLPRGRVRHRRVLLEIGLAPSGLLGPRLAASRPQRELRYGQVPGEMGYFCRFYAQCRRRADDRLRPC